MPCLVHHPTIELLEPSTLEVEGAGLLRLATPQCLQVKALQFGDQAAILKCKSIRKIDSPFRYFMGMCCQGFTKLSINIEIYIP